MLIHHQSSGQVHTHLPALLDKSSFTGSRVRVRVRLLLNSDELLLDQTLWELSHALLLLRALLLLVALLALLLLTALQ